MNTHDTSENRFLKYVLFKIKDRFQYLKKQILALPEFTLAYHDELNKIEKEFKQLVFHPFLEMWVCLKGFGKNL